MASPTLASKVGGIATSTTCSISHAEPVPAPARPGCSAPGGRRERVPASAQAQPRPAKGFRVQRGPESSCSRTAIRRARKAHKVVGQKMMACGNPWRRDAITIAERCRAGSRESGIDRSPIPRRCHAPQACDIRRIENFGTRNGNSASFAEKKRPPKGPPSPATLNAPTAVPAPPPPNRHPGSGHRAPIQVRRPRWIARP